MTIRPPLQPANAARLYTLESSSLTKNDATATATTCILCPVQLYPAPITLHPTTPTSCTLYPTPCTLHPAPCTLHPISCTLTLQPMPPNPTPCTLRPNPAPCTLHLNPASCTLCPCTLYPEPSLYPGCLPQELKTLLLDGSETVPVHVMNKDDVLLAQDWLRASDLTQRRPLIAANTCVALLT